MTIYQEAHSKIDQMPEETVFLFVQLMDRMNENASVAKKRSTSKKKFLESAGTIDVDGESILRLREESIL